MPLYFPIPASLAAIRVLLSGDLTEGRLRLESALTQRRPGTTFFPCRPSPEA
jgi:hypothetical protein